MERKLCFTFMFAGLILTNWWSWDQAVALYTGTESWAAQMWAEGGSGVVVDLHCPVELYLGGPLLPCTGPLLHAPHITHVTGTIRHKCPNLVNENKTENTYQVPAHDSLNIAAKLISQKVTIKSKSFFFNLVMAREFWQIYHFRFAL